MMGVKAVWAQIEDGTAKADGNSEIMGQLASTLVVFDPRFEIMPGTGGACPGRDAILSRVLAVIPSAPWVRERRRRRGIPPGHHSVG